MSKRKYGSSLEKNRQSEEVFYSWDADVVAKHFNIAFRDSQHIAEFHHRMYKQIEKITKSDELEIAKKVLKKMGFFFPDENELKGYITIDDVKYPIYTDLIYYDDLKSLSKHDGDFEFNYYDRWMNIHGRFIYGFRVEPHKILEFRTVKERYFIGSLSIKVAAKDFEDAVNKINEANEYSTYDWEIEEVEE